MKQLDPKPSDAQLEIDRLYGELKLHDPESDEYHAIQDRLVTQSDLNTPKVPEKKTLDPNTILLAVTNVVGIVVVLAYEHAHPIAGKAFGLISKLRI